MIPKIHRWMKLSANLQALMFYFKKKVYTEQGMPLKFNEAKVKK